MLVLVKQIACRNACAAIAYVLQAIAAEALRQAVCKSDIGNLC